MLTSASRKFPKTMVSSAGAHMTNVNFCHEIDCKNILKGCLACACRTYLSCGSTKLLVKDGWWGAWWFVQLCFIPSGTWKYLPFNLVTSQVARPALIPPLYAHSSFSSSSRPTSCRSLIKSFSPWWPGKQETLESRVLLKCLSTSDCRKVVLTAHRLFPWILTHMQGFFFGQLAILLRQFWKYH